ncbi:MAG: AAA family ATPase [Geoalkalibacter sp.]|jgi:aminoglycoside phosphotransferase family enzyme/predicted kinase|uniref:bifunctional aminoglycoside phosphotransferase/ATP-binding protein n=1 Tax=Geoalkalibacter sp. TaxID=3041440 RepID=UPI003D12893F
MLTESLHKALMQTGTYPEGTSEVGFIETHVSKLYFTAQHVYKLKKPVNFKFLDFTTLDRRRFYCEEEVRLNRRFAPDMYLGVMEIREDHGRISIGGPGTTIEYAVRMIRLPSDRMLDHLIDRQATELPTQIDRLAPLLAHLEDEAPVCQRNGGRNNFDAVRGNWQENFEQMAPFIGQTLSSAAEDICHRYVEKFLQEHEELLLRREDEGFVREGHGDLHAEHICLTDPIRIYDCIEFNRRFRAADVAADLAFLLMDLEYRQRRDLSARLLAGYRAHAQPDADLPNLLEFYKIYRAYVRGKVQTFLQADPQAEDATRHEARLCACRYFNLALGYLLPSCLILVGGLMGAGKSTLALELSRANGANLLRSDVVRKHLAGLHESTPAPANFARGIYTPEWNRRVYDEMLRQTQALLSDGRSVIVDASFSRKQDRVQFRQLARRMQKPSLFIHLACDTETLERRLQQRREDPHEVSDGRQELLADQAAHFQQPGEEECILSLDGTHDPCQNAQNAICEILSRKDPTA